MLNLCVWLFLFYNVLGLEISLTVATSIITVICYILEYTVTVNLFQNYFEFYTPPPFLGKKEKRLTKLSWASLILISNQIFFGRYIWICLKCLRTYTGLRTKQNATGEINCQSSISKIDQKNTDLFYIN